MQVQWRPREFSVLLALVGCAINLCIVDVVRAQVDYCEPGLRTDSQNPQSYRNLPEAAPDRCEGLYIQPVAARDTLRVASLVAFHSDFKPEDSDTIEIRWELAPEYSIHLQAQSFGRRYYRMDTERSAARSFVWSTSVLTALGLRGRDLGTVGWTTMNIGDRQERVYLPVAVGQAPQGHTPGLYQLDIEPAQELDEVYLTVTLANIQGELVDVITDQTALEYGYYPARAATVIYLELPSAASQLFWIQISAALSGGGWAANEFWIYTGAH